MSSIVDASSSDIVILTETWLSSGVRDSEIFHCSKGYRFFRHNRSDRRGGGVLIAVNDSMECFHVDIVTPLELVCVRLRCLHRYIIMCVCYRPPNAPANFTSDLYDALNVISSRFPRAPLLLLGDFNLPLIDWSGAFPIASGGSSDYTEFLNLCADFSFSQLVTEPTRVTSTTANILDLILSTDPDLVSSITYLPGISDHSILHFYLQLPAYFEKKTTKHFLDYDKANFDTINSELAAFLDEFLFNFSHRTVDTNWNMFKTKVSSLITSFIPCRPIISNHLSPWFNRSVKRLSNKKKRLFRTAKLTGLPERWEAYNAAACSYKTAIAEAKRTFFSVTLPSMLTNSPKQFWNMYSGSKNTVLSLTCDDGVVVPSQSCASVLNEYFVKEFASDVVPVYPGTFPRYGFFQMDPLVFDYDGIIKLIDDLKPSSSCGVDNITPKFLKRTKNYISIFLCKIFQQSVNLGVLPDDWKIGKVIPLHKSGSKHNPSNYRPISLISTPCKILEHVIYSHLANFLDSNSFFTASQHGFRKSLSCETQLITFTNDLLSILDRGSQVDCVFLDFCKAFDKVSHKLLLFKLSHLHVDPNILSWIECFLTNRSQFVYTNDANSSLSPVTSGVPQGSVLGPLLFLIYINDLPTCVSSSISLFADDCVIYREVTNESDSLLLQNDLCAVSQWCELWQMSLNINKCKSMRVSRRHTVLPPLSICNTQLQSVTCYKYLGVHITYNMSWKTHIDHIIANANSMLGFLKRNFTLAPVSLKLLLYNSLVRSKLEYAAAIWDPGHSTLITNLEAMQNRGARFILSNYHRTASVSSMKLSLSLPSLSLRRKISRLCLFYKIYHSNTSLKDKLFLEPPFISPRFDHPFKVGVPHCNTSAFLNAFIPKTSLEWNHLPASFVNMPSIDLFKKALSAHLLS